MTLDSLLVLLSDTAWKLVPIVLIVLLIYVILLLRHAIILARETKKAVDMVNQDLQKLEKPLQTVNELSETIDMVHEASRNAVRSALVTIIENASNIKEWIFSKKNEHVVSSEAQEVDDHEK